MAQYVWDLAFDYKASPIGLASPTSVTDPTKPEYYPLQMGFVAMLTPPQVSSPMTALRKDDILVFNLFNVTNPPGDGYEVIDVRIAFRAADVGGLNLAPFPTSVPVKLGDGSTALAETQDGIVTIPVGVNTKVLPSGGSTYFGPSLQCWSLTGALQFSIEGRFEMGALVKIEKGTDDKTFIGDPEMIIGGAG